MFRCLGVTPGEGTTEDVCVLCVVLGGWNTTFGLFCACARLCLLLMPVYFFVSWTREERSTARHREVRENRVGLEIYFQGLVVGAHVKVRG